MCQYRLNTQAGAILVRQCAHESETCGKCDFWADCPVLARFGGKRADKKAKDFLKKLNPKGRLALESKAIKASKTRKAA